MAEKTVITNENEKETQQTAPVIKKERFEFKLTVNGNIICQRYFRINGFKREAYGSYDLMEAVENCVRMIDNDLRDKTHMFLEYTAPQVFEDVEQMEKYLSTHKMKEPLFIALRNEDGMYVFNNGKVEPYNRAFNRNDYINNKMYENPVTLKFSFIDNGREVSAKVWDCTSYPRFIRTNVDISNSKNKYKQDGIFAPIESYMMDKFIEAKTDLIPSIVKELCNVCSFNNPQDYTTTAEYGGKTYDFDIHCQNRKYFKSLENKYKKKTAEYFNRR